MTADESKKSGFVVLAGRPNAGKSTLLNALVGTKLAITSPKPQTTRFNIRGVIHRPEGQAVLVDTPGVFRRAGNRLTERVNQRLNESLEDVDLIVHVADPTRHRGREDDAVEIAIFRTSIPVLLVINKMDLPDKPFLDDWRDRREHYAAVYEVSATKPQGIPPLVDAIFERLPTGVPFFEEFQLTDQPNRLWIAELIREKVFLQFGKEVPYTCTVEVDEIADRPVKDASKPPMLYIRARIITLDARYRPILLGSGGRKIKAIGEAARGELEVAMNRRVYLQLTVEVDKRWMDRFE